MKKWRTVQIATSLAISSAAIIAVAPVQSDAATSLTSQISKAKITMKKPYDRYIQSTGKLAKVNTVSSDIAKAKKAKKDVNAAIKKAKLSSKQKKAKYAQVKAYAKYIERAQGYVDAYQTASKASTTFTNLSGEISKAIVIKDVSTIQEQSTALKNDIVVAKKKINHMVYGAKVKALLFKTFTTPAEDQVASLKALNKDLFSAVLTKAKTQTALKDILDAASENAYVAIDMTGATEDLTFNTTKALNITVKGDLSGRNITINTPNSDIVNNATNVGTVIINDVSNNSFHQGSGTVQKVEMNDKNGGHITNADFTNLKDLDAVNSNDKLKNLNDRISAGAFIGAKDDVMNRAQFAKVAALTLNLPLDANLQTSSFSDVKADNPVNGYALPYIEAIKKAGIIDGTVKGEFNPGGVISREELANIFARMWDIQRGPNNVLDFSRAYIDFVIECRLLGNREEIINPGAKKPDISLAEGTNITLSGNFGKVTAEGDATVTVDTGTTVGTLVSNGDVTLTAPKGSISEISGSGTVDPTPASEFNDTDVQNAGGNTPPDITPIPTPTPTNPNPSPTDPNPGPTNPNQPSPVQQ